MEFLEKSNVNGPFEGPETTALFFVSSLLGRYDVGKLFIPEEGCAHVPPGLTPQ
jgi:hypothetical protein